MKKQDDTTKDEILINYFRKVLKDDRRTLMWWHEVYITKNPKAYQYTYSNFVRKVNIPAEMTPELRKEIKKYLESINN